MLQVRQVLPDGGTPQGAHRDAQNGRGHYAGPVLQGLLQDVQVRAEPGLAHQEAPPVRVVRERAAAAAGRSSRRSDILFLNGQRQARLAGQQQQRWRRNGRFRRRGLHLRRRSPISPHHQVQIITSLRRKIS
uniref:(northern house mosquito) hypothetical protein n=1 Tax=Culex pipiens TaxID=7175 RepID=A0A8D8GP56_CULPI